MRLLSLILIGIMLVACSTEPSEPPSSAKTEVAEENEPPLVYPEPKPINTYISPDEAARRQGSKPMPRPKPEANPEATPGLISVEPTEEAVKAYLIKHHNVIVEKIEIRTVVLDFDRDDEKLVRVTLRSGTKSKARKGLMLLDKRRSGDVEDYRVIKTWIVTETDVHDKVVGHGRGDRAGLIVEQQGDTISRLEMYQLMSGGVLTRTANLGGKIGQHGLKKIVYEGYKNGGHSVVVEHGAAKDRYQFVVQDKGFRLTQKP